MSTIADEPRMNDIVRGWHRRFNTIVAKHHPNIYEFLERLKGEQAHTDTLVEQLIAGQQLQQLRMKVYLIPIKSNPNSCRIKNSRIILVIFFQVRKENERILRVVQSYGDHDNMEYLRGIGYNLNY